MTDNAYGISSLLIATDGSAYADVAAECSAWLATRLDARVTTRYVIDARRLASHVMNHIAEILDRAPSEALTDSVFIDFPSL